MSGQYRTGRSGHVVTDTHRHMHITHRDIQRHREETSFRALSALVNTALFSTTPAVAAYATVSTRVAMQIHRDDMSSVPYPMSVLAQGLKRSKLLKGRKYSSKGVSTAKSNASYHIPGTNCVLAFDFAVTTECILNL
eukprot:3568683-Rhodomonas_salina.3